MITKETLTNFSLLIVNQKPDREHELFLTEIVFTFLVGTLEKEELTLMICSSTKSMKSNGMKFDNLPALTPMRMECKLEINLTKQKALSSNIIDNRYRQLCHLIEIQMGRAQLTKFQKPGLITLLSGIKTDFMCMEVETKSKSSKISTSTPFCKTNGVKFSITPIEKVTRLLEL
jgi:hypothetical protein